MITPVIVLLWRRISDPIIERLGNDYEYVANDISVGLNMETDDFVGFLDGLNLNINQEFFNDTNGMLLFGTNARERVR